MEKNNQDLKKAITADDVLRRINMSKLEKTVKQLNSNLKNQDTFIKDFAKAVTKDFQELQDQVDGTIATWFFNGVPTLENQPANEWLSDTEKNNHLGDLYYNQDTGYAYRFTLIDGEYTWVDIKDTDIAKALAIANSAQDTADRKRTVFVETPFPPYEVGDLWIKEDKELYRCRAKKVEGEYESVDWIPATEYTNDDYAKGVENVLSEFKQTVEKDYVTNVRLEKTRNSIEAEVESTTTKLLTKFNDYETVENVEKVINRVENIQTATEQTIKIVEDIQENGVKKVNTQTGYTFDAEGMKVDKTGAPTGGIFNDAGMEIIDKLSSALMTLFYSGYVNEAMVEKVSALANYLGQTVTYTNSLIFSKYLSSANIRMEDTEDPVFGKGLGFFYIGGDS